MDRQHGEQFDALGLETAFAPEPEVETEFDARLAYGGEDFVTEPSGTAPASEDLAWLGEVLEAEQEVVKASDAEWLESEWLDTRDEAAGAESVEAFATRLGAEWSARRRGTPAADAMRSWLLQDHEDTLAGARLRWSTKKVAAGFWDRVTRAWMVSREQQMRFQTEAGSGVRRLGAFGPPATRATLSPDPLIRGSDKAPVAPLTSRFARELRRLYPGVDVTTYRGHGGGAFLDRGYSVDLFIPGRDTRGFYRAEDATRLLRAIHAAARAVGAQWRAIYNDFGVADALNRALKRQHVIFVGGVRRDRSKRVAGLNWHGPDPLILHVHLDITPLSGVDQGEAEADEAQVDDELFSPSGCRCGTTGEAERWDEAMAAEPGESWRSSEEDEQEEERGRYDPPESGFGGEPGAEMFEDEDEEGETVTIDSAGLSPAELKAVRITSALETGKRGGFAGLTGNGDGQGLSFGLVNWTIGTGSLQPLLRAFAREHPSRWATIFGANADRFRKVIEVTGPAAEQRQLHFAVEEMNARRPSRNGTSWSIRQPWSDYFARLGHDPAFRAIQIRYVRPLLAKADEYCRQFRLKSEMAFTFMFDAVSSHGKWWLTKKFGGVKRRQLLLEQKLRERGASVGGLPEGDLLLLIADILGTTSAPRYAAKVRRRKRWFVLGDAELERNRNLSGLRPRADTPYTLSRPAPTREDEQDLAWRDFEAFGEDAEEPEAFEQIGQETAWEEESRFDEWESFPTNEGATGWSEAEDRPSLAFEGAVLEAAGLGEGFAWEQEDEEKNCKSSFPAGCVDYSADYAKRIRRRGTAEGEIMDRTQGDRQINLALQFRDYDVNAYLPGTKTRHAEGLVRITEFIQARAAVADEVRVSITGSASLTGTQCFNQALSEKRAECMAERIISDVPSAFRPKLKVDVRGDGFTQAKTEGATGELPGYRSVLVSVHGKNKPLPIPPEPPGWDKYSIRCCSFASRSLGEAAIDELLKKLPKDVPEGLARGLIGKLRERLEKQLRRLLKRLPKLGALVGDVSKLLRFLPIEITRQRAVFQIRERGTPSDPRQITLCYDGFGFRLALPIPGDIDDALEELLRKVPWLGTNATLRKALKEVIKRELNDLLPGRLTKLMSKLDSNVPGPWKSFELNRHAPIEVFRGPADIFIDVVSGVMDPGSIFLAFDGRAWNDLARGKLQLRCATGCAGSLIQLQVDGGIGFDLLSVNKGKLDATACVCEPAKESELFELAEAF